MKINYLVLLIGAFFIFSMISGVSAVSYETNISTSDMYTTVSNYPSLVVQVLKYDPYPVNAGDWFDLWVKVQNIGQMDARDVRFELVPDYPFYANDTARDYGLIYGTVNAYKVDQQMDASQVIVKYRVQVADNAPEGVSNLKIKISSNKLDSTSPIGIVDLPITIAKTKTDFEVVMQGSDSGGISLALANIGDNGASAVTVKLLSNSSFGSASAIVGTLNKGDFTTVTLPVSLGNRTSSGTRTGTGARNFTDLGSSGMRTLPIEISYTDSAGIRTTLDKEVQITQSLTSRTATATTASTGMNSYLVFFIGLLVGIAAIWGYGKYKRRNK